LSRETPSPLELLLPTGVARATAVLGSGCPPRLLPCTGGSATPDLAVLAPSERERRTAWAEAAAATVARTLPQAGTAVIIAPAATRRRLVRSLRGHGFRTVGHYLHLPSVARTVFAVPLRRATLRYVADRLIVRRSWRRSALLALSLLPWPRAVAAFAPSTGVVMRRAEEATGLAWLGVRDGVLQLPRPGRDGAVVHGFDSLPLPSVIAKIRTRSEASNARAGDAVREDAAAAGVRAPRVLRRVPLDGASAAIEEALHGRPAASALAAKGDERALALLADLERLLARWSSASLGQPLLQQRLEHETIERARTLQPLLGPDSGYVDHLATLLGRDLAGRTVASHNDMTSWNILVEDTGGLALLDWDDAEAEGLPLVDFAYAAVDAVAIAGDVDRLAAYRRCFRDVSVGARVRGALGRLATIAQLTPAAAELCLHACWLRHACNEQLRGERPTAFLEVAREVAAGGARMRVE
jgi:hypothetical protein